MYLLKSTCAWRPKGVALLTQIALDSGFGDISYFGRAFRLRYGCSPREWRHEAAEARAAAAE